MKNLVLLFLLTMLMMTGCLPEKKIANRFIESPPAINLMVLSPDFVYKFNHKGEQIPRFDTLSADQQDSALWVTSSYMQFVNDSILLESYMNSFIGELRTLGFTVYLSSSMDSFLTDKPQSYLLNVSQIQLDEYFYPLEDEEVFDDTVYYKRFDLNGVDLSCWFELNKINSGNPRKTLLFSSGSAYDDFSGSFNYDPWTGGVKYRYKIDTLQVSNIYDMAASLGKRHASYTFDFFLNLYIAKNLSEGAPMFNYYHYNRFRKSVSPTEEDRFEIL